MDSVNEVTFFAALAVTVPVGLALVLTGPVLMGHSLPIMALTALLVSVGLYLLTKRVRATSPWNRAGAIFLIGGVLVGLGSIEIIMALFLALIIIDVLLGAFTGAEHLLGDRGRETDRS